MTQPPPPPGNYPPPGGYPPPENVPPAGGYPPPPAPGGYPPPPAPGGYPPPPAPGGYPPPPAGGNYPPPQGNYPPPPGGGYPPPPPPQGGYAPPPPGYPGAPAFGGPGQGFNVGEAFSWAWNKFSKNAAALIVPTLVYGIVIGIVYGIVYGVAIALAPSGVSSYESYGGSVSYSYSAGLGVGSYLVLALGGIVLLVLVAAAASAYIGGVLDIANGQPVQIGSFFKPRNIGSVILATVIVGLLTSIGYVLCVIPGLIVALFTYFTTVIVIERGGSPIDGIKASVELVKANVVPTILAWVVMAAITFVGSLVCGIGLIVALPVAALFQVYAYRKLSGGPIAALTP